MYSDLEVHGYALNEASALNLVTATAFIRPPFPSVTVFSDSGILMEYSGNHSFFPHQVSNRTSKSQRSRGQIPISKNICQCRGRLRGAASDSL